MRPLLLFVLLAVAGTAIARVPPLGSVGEGIGLLEMFGWRAAAVPAEVTTSEPTEGPTPTGESTSEPSEGPTEETGVTTQETEVTTQWHDNGLSGGEIAGIVIGSLAGVALIAGGVFYLYKKEKLCFDK